MTDDPRPRQHGPPSRSTSAAPQRRGPSDRHLVRERHRSTSAPRSRRPADRRARRLLRRGPVESKVVIVGSGPGRPDRRDLRGAGQPRADRHRRLRAGRPADDHERRRELPGLPGRDPGPRADGRLPRPGRAVRDADRRRRHRPGRLLGAAVPLWARGTEYRGPVGHRRDGRVGAVAGPRERDAAARPRRVAPARPATASSSATRRSRSSAAATRPSRRRRS